MSRLSISVFSFLAMGTMGILAVPTSVVFAQDYPTKTVRIITNEAGGATDILVRQLASRISGPLGQPVIVENRSSTVSGGLVAKAPADGYTLLTAGTTVILQPLLGPADYDPIKDFAPITIALKVPLILVVNSSVPVKSVKELIALAKAKPGALNYASTGTGAGSHLAAELLKQMTGADIVRIEYKGTGPALTDLVAGATQMFFNPPGALVPFIKSGKLRPLAVASLHPSKQMPDLPPVADTLPGFEMATTTGFLAPAKTPMPVIRRLNQEMVRVLDQTEFQDKLADLGEIGGSTPEEYAANIKSDVTKTAKLIKDAGISTAASR